MGDGWELYTSPKKKPEPKPGEAAAPVPTSDGTALTSSPKAAKPASAPTSSADGTMELPGSPRPKPKPEAKSAESDADFRRQVPKSVEEDAEVWDSSKGWTTPSGKKDNLAPGAVEGAQPTSPEAAGPEAPKVESDEDTEVVVAPKRVLPPEGPIRPRTGGPLQGAKVGKEGKDFDEYNTVVRPPWMEPPTRAAAPPPSPPTPPSNPFASFIPGAPQPAPPATPSASFPAPSSKAPFGLTMGPAAEPPRLYGQSAVASPSSSALPRPSGKTEVFGAPAPAAAPSGRPSGRTEIVGATGPARPAGSSAAAPSTPSAVVPMAPPQQVHAAGLPKGTLNVLLVGSGAREHAMALAIRRSQRAHLFVVMAHRNPGLAKSATGFKILDPRDARGIVEWARQQKVHLAVLGPESALEAGVSDALRAAGIAVASPSQAAARIETSKTFMRELMERHGLPGRLAHHAFTQAQPALDFLARHGPEWAVKPVGLTGGKGVQVFGDHFHDLAGAQAYVRSLFGPQGGAVQFEELARGEEFTLMAFTDGTTLLPMPAVQDHKRLLEGDKGPNTGGMGSYAQADGLLPFLGPEDYTEALRILHGIVAALAAEGTPYVGTIYGQFMLTAAGPKVIEVNARFGDPEAVNVLHTLESDYLGLLEGMATGALAGREARFRGVATVVKCVVPKGYGTATPPSGTPIEIDDFNVKRAGGAVYVGAIEQKPYGGIETMSGRALAVLGEGPTVEMANAVCEASLRHIHAKDVLVRHDIGTPELLARRVAHMSEVRAQGGGGGGSAPHAPQAML